MLCCATQFPYSARHGLEWWEIDPTWYLICILKALGIVWDVQVRGAACAVRWVLILLHRHQIVCCQRQGGAVLGGLTGADRLESLSVKDMALQEQPARSHVPAVCCQKPQLLGQQAERSTATEALHG